VRAALLFLVAFAALGLAYDRSRRAADPERWRPLLALLHHIERDYADALDENEVDELDEADAMLGAIERTCREDGPRGRHYAARVTRLRELVASRAAPDVFEAELTGLVDAIVRGEQLVTHPEHVPDVEHGRALFATHCAGCHETVAGHKPPAGKLLRPSPVSFFAADVTEHMTPLKVYDVVSHGIPGTPMASFAALSERDRWDLAYFVPAMRHPACEGPGIAVAEASLKTNRELEGLVGVDAVACARWRPLRP
jgi:high-affinity iron transporter